MRPSRSASSSRNPRRSGRAVSRCASRSRPKIAEHSRPIVLRRTSHELVAGHDDAGLAGVTDEAATQFLGVQIDMLREPLGDTQPDIVGRYRQREMFRECDVGRVDEGMDPGADEIVEIRRARLADRRQARANRFLDGDIRQSRGSARNVRHLEGDAHGRDIARCPVHRRIDFHRLERNVCQRRLERNVYHGERTAPRHRSRSRARSTRHARALRRSAERLYGMNVTVTWRSLSTVRKSHAVPAVFSHPDLPPNREVGMASSLTGSPSLT